MWILSTDGRLPEQTFRILPGGVRTIGRATGADFIVDAPLVSRVHCRLTALADGEPRSARPREHQRHLRQRPAGRDGARLASGDRLQVGRVELVALRDRLSIVRAASGGPSNDYRFAQVLQDERIRRPLAADRRVRPVARMHDRVVAQRKQHPGDRPHQDVVVAAGQIGAADRAGKQRVADEQVLPGRALRSNLQADAARTVTRRVVDAHFVVAEVDRAAVVVGRRPEAAAGP